MSLTIANPVPCLEACRGRQNRLLGEMSRYRVDMAVLSRRESIYWLTGVRVDAPFTAVATIDADAHVLLVLPSRMVDGPVAADRVLPYVEKRLSSTRDLSDQCVDSLTVLFDNLTCAPKRAACEFSAAPMPLASALPERPIDLDPILFRLRRRKDADEVAMIRRANDANQAMYALARQIVAPGVNELELYNQLHAAAVRELGEPLTYLGHDFRSGARGGKPRNRQCQRGELCILDLGVGYRGYHSDNARTLAVGGEPNEMQQSAWRSAVDVFSMVEATVKPGAKCKFVYDEAQAMLANRAPWQFDHHLGHGIGLAPQEAPRLNPNWNDVFEAGDVIAVEPGLYHEDLNFGVRLEQNYLVTETGVELLTDWPLGL